MDWLSSIWSKPLSQFTLLDVGGLFLVFIAASIGCLIISTIVSDR
jgi:hypothetical protein